MKIYLKAAICAPDEDKDEFLVAEVRRADLEQYFLEREMDPGDYYLESIEKPGTIQIPQTRLGLVQVVQSRDFYAIYFDDIEHSPDRLVPASRPEAYSHLVENYKAAGLTVFVR